MIPERSEAFWPDDEHPKAARFRLQKPQQKWQALDLFRRHSPRTDWKFVYADLRSLGPDLKHSLSEEEVFQQAAAQVDHKIQMDRKILGGAPRIAGTRIPVYAILQLVEAGYSHKRILKSFPSLSIDDLQAALKFSVLVMER
jgi:uncharacterized protein (DUF433 family)